MPRTSFWIIVTACATVAGGGGCASLNPRESFPSVSEAAQARTGAPLYWNEHPAEFTLTDGLRIGTLAALAGPASLAAPPPNAPGPATSPGQAPVTVPNGWVLPHKLVDGWKVWHLVAEQVDHELAPGLAARCWGYNGSVHGPVIEAVEGDRVRIFVTNRLPEATTVHWHGAIVPAAWTGSAA